MAVPALPPENTRRLFLDYSGNFGQRVAVFRSSGPGADGDITSVIENALDFKSHLWGPDVLFIRWRVAASGSNVTNPVKNVGIVGSATLGGNLFDAPRFFSWTGRSPDGHKVRWTLYGVQAGTEADYRLESGDNADLDYLRSTIGQLADDGLIVTISGQPPVVNPYTNIGYNAYYQRQRRKTGP